MRTLCRRTLPDLAAPLDRRQFCGGLLALGAGGAASPKDEVKDRSMTLGIGTYGMPKMTTEKAIALIADVGFDSVGLIVQPDRDAAPGRMSVMRRKAVRKLLADRGLLLTSLLERFTPQTEAKAHKATLLRVEKACELAHDLRPDAPPLIDTGFGQGVWEKVRTLYRDCLGDWVETAKKNKIVIAIKPHRGFAMNLPEHAVWLIEQLKKTPWLRIVYDYSHFDLRGLSVKQTIATSAPYLALVAVKDVEKRDGKEVFLLPGESGRIDYVDLFQQLHKAGYRGDVSCEVSVMVWNKAGYDPATAARACYAKMAPAMEKAGVRKRR